MKNLKEMGLTPLSELQSLNFSGGSTNNGIFDTEFIVCCINIPPMDKFIKGLNQ